MDDKNCDAISRKIRRLETEVKRLTDELAKRGNHVELDIHSNHTGAKQQRELDGALAVGQLLAGGKNSQASDSETKRKLILSTDTFSGTDDALIDSMRSLVELDLEDALIPHGIGGHARSLLVSAAIRLEALRSQQAAVPAWQPIETAPKDGTFILVWNSNGINEVYWDTDSETWEHDIEFDNTFPLRGTLPTHWMPLPAAPEIEK